MFLQRCSGLGSSPWGVGRMLIEECVFFWCCSQGQGGLRLLWIQPNSELACSTHMDLCGANAGGWILPAPSPVGTSQGTDGSWQGLLPPPSSLPPEPWPSEFALLRWLCQTQVWGSGVPVLCRGLPEGQVALAHGLVHQGPSGHRVMGSVREGQLGFL